MERLWEKEYEHLLEESRAQGELVEEPKPSNRRQHPRFSLRSGSVGVRVIPSFSVIDVSVSGISFYADIRFQPGESIHIVLDKTFLVEGQVVDCQMVIYDPDFLEMKYRTHCSFADPEHGMQLLVMIKEMNNINLVAPENPA